MFVDRNPDGSLRGIYAAAQYEAQEEIADDSPEIAAFRDAIGSLGKGRDDLRGLQRRRADSLAASDSIDDKLEALKIRLELLGG